jgi:hypothetical protein
VFSLLLVCIALVLIFQVQTTVDALIPTPTPSRTSIPSGPPTPTLSIRFHPEHEGVTDTPTAAYVTDTPTP